MKQLNGLTAAVALVTFTLLPTVIRAGGKDKAADEMAIRKLLETAVKAYNDHDAKSWSVCFHTDVGCRADECHRLDAPWTR